MKKLWLPALLLAALNAFGATSTQRECEGERCLTYTVSIPYYDDENLIHFALKKTFYAGDRTLSDLPELVRMVVSFGLALEPEEGEVAVDWSTASKAQTNWQDPEKQGFLTQIATRTTFADPEGRRSSTQNYYVFEDTSALPLTLNDILHPDGQKADLRPLAEQAFAEWQLKKGLAETLADAENAVKAQFGEQDFPISENWRMGHNALILHYGLYELGDKRLGEVDLTIPAAALNGVIAEDIVQAMQAAPSATPPAEAVADEDETAADESPSPERFERSEKMTLEEEPPQERFERGEKMAIEESPPEPMDEEEALAEAERATLFDTFPEAVHDDPQFFEITEEKCYVDQSCLRESVFMPNFRDPNLLAFMLRESFAEPDADIADLRKFILQDIDRQFERTDVYPPKQRQLMWSFTTFGHFTQLNFIQLDTDSDGRNHLTQKNYFILHGQKWAMSFRELWQRDKQREVASFIREQWETRPDVLADIDKPAPSLDDINNFRIENNSINIMSIDGTEVAMFLTLEEYGDLLLPSVRDAAAYWPIIN